jgi:hypothetical protein
LLEVCGFPGAREELARWGNAERTESMLRLLRDAGLPIPITEVAPAQVERTIPREG